MLNILLAALVLVMVARGLHRACRREVGDRPASVHLVRLTVNVILVVIAWGTVVIFSDFFAARPFRHPAILAAETTSDSPEWLILIGRRPERRGSADPTPHRNSPLALYQRLSGDEWHRRHGDLVCRSTTTTASPPAIADRAEVEGFARERSVAYRWGHVSVPPGLYSLTPAPWRTGDTAFMISTLHSADGTIALEAPQTLITVALASDEQTGLLAFVPDPDVPPIVSYVKEWCYLHPSPTRDWSHRDSLGCINLLSLPRPGEERSDYDAFFSWIEDEGLLGEPLALCVASFEAIAGPGATELPETLTLEGL